MPELMGRHLAAVLHRLICEDCFSFANAIPFSVARTRRDIPPKHFCAEWFEICWDFLSHDVHFDNHTRFEAFPFWAVAVNFMLGLFTGPRRLNSLNKRLSPLLDLLRAPPFGFLHGDQFDRLIAVGVTDDLIGFYV